MLIATGIMAIGLVMIATIFPVGVKLTGMSAERSVAVVVADEAFAKIQLYGLRDFADWPAAQIAENANDPLYLPNWTDATYDFCDDYLFTAEVIVKPGLDTLWGTADDIYTSPGPDGVYGSSQDVDINLGDEFLYPSAVMSVAEKQKYHWSALCRRVSDKDVQVTVFVMRKTFAGMNYYGYFQDRTSNPNDPQPVYDSTSIWPMPVPVNVRYNYNGSVSPPLRELVIDLTDPINADWQAVQAGLVFSFFDENYTIVNGRDGKIYRILEVKDADGDVNHTRETLVLYEGWQWDGYDSDPSNPPTSAQVETIWVVPPGAGSTRYPCVGVFQKVIRFDDIQ